MGVVELCRYVLVNVELVYKRGSLRLLKVFFYCILFKRMFFWFLFNIENSFNLFFLVKYCVYLCSVSICILEVYCKVIYKEILVVYWCLCFFWLEILFLFYFLVINLNCIGCKNYF